MIEQLKQAIELRTNKDFSESEKEFEKLILEYPESGEIVYHYAWLCDNMNREKEACSKYEKALTLGLSKEDLKGCYLGLGSTYRCIGAYEKSVSLLDKAIAEFPENSEFKVFKAMALYNLEHYEEAMKLLLTLIADTSKDSGIQDYSNAIRFYSDKLHKKFD